MKMRTDEEREYDVIVCATGFDRTFHLSFPFTDSDGFNLSVK